MDFKTTIAKLLFMVAVALSIASCSKEADQLTINEESSDAFISAQKEFAKILSSALYEEPDLRAFLKNEALKEFDMITMSSILIRKMRSFPETGRSRTFLSHIAKILHP